MDLAITLKINEKCKQRLIYLADAWEGMLIHLNAQEVYKVLERDSKGVIHYHGRVISHAKADLKLLAWQFTRRVFTGTHLFLRLITDKRGWERYCLKDQEKPEPLTVGGPRPVRDPSAKAYTPLSDMQLDVEDQLHSPERDTPSPMDIEDNSLYDTLSSDTDTD